MIEIELRIECATCARVINREYVKKPDWYKGKKIITTHGVCRLCRNKAHYKNKPDYDEEAADLAAEDIRRINNLIGRLEKIR